MGLGGFGPLEYLYLAGHQAKSFQPRLLLVGFSFGTDLIDAYNSVRRGSYWQTWRESGSADAEVSEFERVSGTLEKKRFAALRDWLSRNSVFYSVLRVILLQPLAAWEQDRMDLHAGPDRKMIWIDPSEHSIRTIFSPELKLSALDPRLPSVQEGLRLTKRALAALQRSADTQGARLLLVLVPTKERAYCRYLKDSGTRMPQTLTRLCEAEGRVKDDLVRFLGKNKVAFFDVTGAMEEQIQKHVRLYPSDSEAHPQAAGYGAIARVVHEAVRSLR